MTKVPMYRYLGTNGTITSKVHLEDTYYVRMVALYADPDKKLTNGIGPMVSYVLVPEDEVINWKEVRVTQG